MSIGSRMKEFADNNFKSTADFARHMGKSRSFFQPYFSGTTLPGAEILKKMAELGCDINWLLTGIESDASSSQIRKKFGLGREIKVSDVENIVSHYEKLIEQKDRLIDILDEMVRNRNKE